MSELPQKSVEGYNDDDMEMHEFGDEFLDIYNDRPNHWQQICWSTLQTPIELITRFRAIYGNPRSDHQAVMIYEDEQYSNPVYIPADQLVESIEQCTGTILFVSMENDDAKLQWHVVQHTQDESQQLNQATLIHTPGDTTPDAIRLIQITATSEVSRYVDEII